MRTAFRALIRAPGFSLVAVLSLGLGIAFMTVTVAVVNAYVLRALPYPSAERLYNVQYSAPGEPQPRGLSGIDWTLLRDVVEIPLASDPDVLYLTEGGYTQAAACSHVTTGFLEGLGIRPAMGRSFREADATSEADRVVMISHALWRERFDMHPDVVGRTFKAYSAEDERATATLTIVGVLPEAFWTSRRIDVLLPLRAGAVTTYMVRLAPGIPVADAERRITEAARTVASEVPSEWRGARLRSVHEQYVADLRPVLRSVSVAAALVLLIACGNVALLMLLRTTRRQKEVAVRMAIGAGRIDVLRMLVTEACVLSAGALAVGLVVAGLGLGAIAPLIEENLGRRVPGGPALITIDATVVAVAGAAGLVVALALSLVPMVSTWRTDLFNTLRREGQEGGGVAGRRLRSVLTSAEIAGALALLVGCGVMVRTVWHLTRTDLGIDTSRVVRAQFSMPSQPYENAAARLAFYDRLSERMGANHALSDWPPLSEPIRHPIEVDALDTSALRVGVTSVTGSYFTMLGMRVLDGRSFESSDRIGSAPVAIVSEALARRLWPEGRAVGRRIRTTEEVTVRAPLTVWRTVVGVTANVRQTFVDQDPLDVYLPFGQAPNRFTSLLLETNAPASSWLADVRGAVQAINPEVAVAPSPSLDASARALLAGPRFLAGVMTGFALFAALLAVLGIYGVVSYAVQQREREIAIRMALGATRRRAMALLVRHGAALIAAGLLVGALAAGGVTRLLRSQLHGVTATDSLTIAVTAAALAAAGLFVSWLPARRAVRRNPVSALKAD